jgi:Zn-dependent M28 family amino/carboxypeptidase
VSGQATDLPTWIELDGLWTHLEALQEIADAHDHNRAAGTEGFDGSVEYVAGVLEDVGLNVSYHEFVLEDFELDSQPMLAQVEPEVENYEGGEDFSVFYYSGSGDVKESVQAVDLVLPPGSGANTSDSGCEPEDFADFEAGNIALIQRGTCTFATKAQYAETAGALGVIIFNEGQMGRTDLVEGSLTSSVVDIPVMGASYALGEMFAGLVEEEDGLVVRMVVDATVIESPTVNVFADTSTGDEERLVVIGAHLDSVEAGPGINDNGTGVATVLEAAVQWAGHDVSSDNRVRFAFWGAEELGLLGSEDYVYGLDEGELSGIYANLNFDMVGSPNPVRFIYDGDGSDTEEEGPQGSGAIESMLQDWFDAYGAEYQATAFNGRSDYGPFIWSGIPAGGLFTGAEQSKSQEEQEAYGGTAGESYDACYHKDCDTIDNVDASMFLEMAQAAAHSLGLVATSQGELGEGVRGAADPGARHRIEISGCHGQEERQTW